MTEIDDCSESTSCVHYESLTYIYNFMLKTKNNSENYLTFSADCSSKRFTIFYDIPGFGVLCKRLKSHGSNKFYVMMKWCEIDLNYNRCESLLFDVQEQGGKK